MCHFTGGEVSSVEVREMDRFITGSPGSFPAGLAAPSLRSLGGGVILSHRLHWPHGPDNITSCDGCPVTSHSCSVSMGQCTGGKLVSTVEVREMDRFIAGSPGSFPAGLAAPSLRSLGGVVILSHRLHCPMARTTSHPVMVVRALRIPALFPWVSAPMGSSSPVQRR